MSIEFRLPDLGEGIHEAEVLAIKISEGDTVKEDQPLFEVETDKAVVEIPSPVSGVVEKVHIREGQIVTVGSVMVSFQVEAAPTPATRPAAAARGEKPGAELVAAGVRARKEEPAAAGARPQAAMAPGRGPVPAAPAVRRMAREMGVDLSMVRGSGPAGRVLKEDVRAYAEGVIGSALAEPATLREARRPAEGRVEEAEPLETKPIVAEGVELPDFSKYGPVERVPLKSVRRKIALNMIKSWTHIPHVTHCDEVDVTGLDEFLEKNEKRLIDAGTKMTLTVFMLKAVVQGLRKYPQFNSSLDERTGEIVLKRYYNIGVAVATQRGLIVPVIRNVDQKSLVQLAAELAEIAAKTREGKIELERLQGGTFTITNIGAIGGTGLTPMINFPEAAILGMARAAQKPVVREGKIEIATILPLALSFDHRIADGAEAAYFVRHVARYLEEPLNLLLEE